MRNVFRSRPGHEAALYAEAQALIDDGLPLEEVLDLFLKDEAWLRPLLETTESIEAAIEAEQPSYYFHASLKSRFLEAANERRYRPAPRRESVVAAKARTVIASATVLAGTATAGLATFGFVTSDNAVPGDWNYSFKLAQERMEYALATGDQKADVQLHQAQARVYEIQKLTERGNVSEDQIRKLENEAAQLRLQLERQGAQGLTEVQKQQLKNFQDLSTVVLNQAQEKNDRVKPAAQSALNAVTEAVAAGSGGSTVAIPEPTREAASPTVAPVSSATPAVGVGADPTHATGAIPEPTSSAGTPGTPPPSATTVAPTATSTPTPTETPTPPPTETPSPTPSPSATAAPSETRTP